MTSKLNQNSDSWIPPAELGTHVPPYRPTYQVDSFINANHESLSTCPVDGEGFIRIGIPGWLWREDALKLYELAYFADGDILEIGCYHGLSTFISAQAVRDSGRRRIVIGVENDPVCATLAEGELAARGVNKYAKIKCEDGASFCREQLRLGRKFGLVFIDHSHTYEDVVEICRLLPGLVSAGGFCLFHDFNDARNNDPDDKEFDVSTAVYDSLSPADFDFYGIFGCAALYRRK